MGRRHEAVMVGGESSPSSAETSFRELDDVFLQTKTKIWISQVLKRVLEKHVHISDLLADGELLFELSKVLWDMLLVKFSELRNAKACPSLFLSQKRGGRYRPYSNVDSFLKVCKVLGLDGIDLFSPSDVVEKRNIRKVCICVRALSKKARSKQLHVPDFDGVSHSAVMPKDMVGYIRRTLETSQCSSTSHSSYSLRKDKRSKLRQKSRISDYDENADSYSNKSDEAESKYIALENETYSDAKFDDHDEETMSSYLVTPQVNPPKRHSLVREESNDSHEKALEVADFDLNASVVGDPLFEEIDRDFLSSDPNFLGPDVDIPSFLDEEDTVWNFLRSIDSDLSESGQKTFRSRYYGKNFEDMEDVEVGSTVSMNSIVGRLLNMDFDDQYDVGDSSTAKAFSSGPLEYKSDCEDKSPFMDKQTRDCHLSDTLSNVSDTDAKEPQVETKLEHEGACSESLSTYQDQGLPGLMECKRPEYSTSEVCPVDTNLATSTNGKEIEKELAANQTSKLHIPDSSQQSNADIAISSPQYEVFLESDILLVESSVEDDQSCSCSSPYPGKAIEDIPCPGHGNMSSSLPNEEFASLASKSECKVAEPPDTLANASVYTIEALEATSSDQNYKDIHPCEPTIEKDGGEHEYSDILANNNLDEKKDHSNGLHKAKPRHKPMLKTVVRGTALVGALIFLLHLSRRGRERTQEPSREQSTQTLKPSKAKSSSRKEENGRKNGSYPAEKLKLVK